MKVHTIRQPSFVKRPSICAQILPRLRQDIIEGHWEPGERLPEPALCEQFGISRTPLRDAFHILEAEGLVELVNNVGAVVSQPNLADLQGSFEVIALLEAGAAQQVARTQPGGCLDELRALIQAMKQTDRLTDLPIYFDLNDRFHRAIVMGADNPVLASMHEHLMIQVNRLRYSYYRRHMQPARTGKGHDQIFHAICEGLPQQAFDLMREHVQDVACRMLSMRVLPS